MPREVGTEFGDIRWIRKLRHHGETPKGWKSGRGFVVNPMGFSSFQNTKFKDVPHRPSSIPTSPRAAGGWASRKSGFTRSLPSPSPSHSRGEKSKVLLLLLWTVPQLWGRSYGIHRILFGRRHIYMTMRVKSFEIMGNNFCRRESGGRRILYSFWYFMD